MAAMAQVGAADESPKGWYDRPMRWMQLAFVEDDPGQYDPKFWLDYFRRVPCRCGVHFGRRVRGVLSDEGSVSLPQQVSGRSRSSSARWSKGCRELGMNVIARTDPHALHQDV